MHATDELRDLYTHAGPFATVYLDASRNTENAEHEIELRWEELRRDLAVRGADDATLDALGEAALGPPGLPGRHGRVLVATEGEVLLDRPLHDPPDPSAASWDELPDVLPYIADSNTDLVHIVVVTDRTGADLDIVLGADSQHETVVGNEQHPIHKTRRNQWDERHFQNRVDNAWQDNAREVARVVARHVAEFSAELVVVAGEERSRAMVMRDLVDELPPGFPLAEVEAGGRAAGTSEEALHDAVRDELLKLVWRRRRELLEHLQQNIGRGKFACTGTTDVLAALRKSQADTVVLSNNPASTLTAWIGPDPLQVGTTPAELRDMGVREPHETRFDAALTRAVVGSGADLEVAPNAHAFLPEGIAALLRYDDGPSA
ncbi:MAG TPA: Vms1/Ankzf1 family peptidyl-tRNA hydrolase [Jatrophihabitantaceae bacterium]|nr:Vms1/Ankzf1 family peptidyl-tRNA hydrolase [Jatrophihabitantaceae bacterium]